MHCVAVYSHGRALLKVYCPITYIVQVDPDLLTDLQEVNICVKYHSEHARLTLCEGVSN